MRENFVIIHGKARLKLNYMKNPSFGELRSLRQINQVCNEENQRRNLTLKNFATPCEIFARQKEISQPFFPLAKFSQDKGKFRNLFSLLRNFCKIEGNFATAFHSWEIFAVRKKILQLLFSLVKFSQLHIWLAKSSCNLQIFLHRLY